MDATRSRKRLPLAALLLLTVAVTVFGLLTPRAEAARFQNGKYTNGWWINGDTFTMGSSCYDPGA